MTMAINFFAYNVLYFLGINIMLIIINVYFGFFSPKKEKFLLRFSKFFSYFIIFIAIIYSIITVFLLDYFRNIYFININTIENSNNSKFLFKEVIASGHIMIQIELSEIIFLLVAIIFAVLVTTHEKHKKKK